MEKFFILEDNLFDNELNSYELNRKRHHLKNEDFCLTEEDFYPPSDDRVWTSNVDDINDENNFANYCEYIFEILDEEEYFDN